MSIKKFGIVAGLVFALSIVLSPAASACSLQDLSSCDNDGLMALIVQMLAGQTTTTTTTTTETAPTVTGLPAGFQFNTNLKLGSTGNDVKYLQILLNADSATAVGNAGSETTYFGSMTQAAVVKFQNKYASEVLTPYGLSAGTGFFGTSSRAKANALLGSLPTTPGITLPAGCTSTSGFSTTTGQRCDSGVSVTLPAGCTSTAGFSPITGERCDGGTVTPVTGAFAVSLAGTNPASGTLIQQQATANLAEYTFSNGTASPVVVTSVTLDRIGVSADTTLAGVYLFDGAVRLTDSATVSAGKVTFNVLGGIFTIPANSTKTIAVKSDIANTTSGQTVGVSLSAITTDGTLSSSLPIAGNIHTIASATLATVAVGTVLPSSATTTDPVSGVRIWEAPITVGQRNVQFTKLALRQINSIDKADISNFQLLVDGVVVSTVQSLDVNGYVTFTFDKVLTTGTRNVKVLADVTGGSSRYIQMSLRNKADIDVKDVDYGVNVSATGLPKTASTIQVNSGTFTIITNNADLPVTIANNASNVLIGKWTFKAAGEAIKVENLKAGFTYDGSGGSTTNAAATLRNGKIMINGAQAGSTATLVPAGTEYAINYTFQPGVETVVEVYADIYDNDGALHGQTTAPAIQAGDTIKAKLVYTASYANGTKQTSLGTVDVPTSDREASTLLVASGSATLVRTPNYGTPQNTSLPQTAFKIGSWTLTAGTAEDINVSGLSFAIAASGGTNFNVHDASDMYVTYKVGSGSEVTTSVVPTPAATQAFSTSFTLPKGQTVIIDLYSTLRDNGLVANDPSTAGAIAGGNGIQATLTVSGTGSQSGAAASITGGATAGQVVTYRAGSLVITRGASTPVASLVSANNNVQTVSYKLEAVNDAYTVSQLVFTINDSTTVSSVLLKDGANTIASAPGNSTVTFNLSPALSVPANTSKDLTIEMVLGNVGPGAGTSGANLATTLASALIRPASTGTSAAGDVSLATAGNGIYVYKAVPTISLLSLPTTTLAAGTNTLQKFTVSSDQNAVAWKQVMFSITRNASGATIANCNGSACTGLKLYQGGVEVPGTMYASGDLTSAGANTITVRFVPNNEEQVAVGATKTYELKATTVGGDVISGKFISTNITRPSVTKTASAPFAKYLTAASTLRYYDISTDATGESVAAGDIRQTAVSKYTTADVTAGATVTGHNAANKISSAYGITGNIVLTIAEGITDNQAAAATFTVSGAGTSDLVCTPYTGADGTGAFASGGEFNTIRSVVCTGTGKGLKILNLTVGNDGDTGVSSSELVITITKAEYAVGSVVGANDSDLGLEFASGTQASNNSASFVWSDLSAQSHSIVTSDWATDYLVKNLSTDAQTLSGT